MSVLNAYRLRDPESGVTEEVQAKSIQGARRKAREWAEGGDYANESTVWVDVEIYETVIDADGDECWRHAEDITVPIDPEEPSCTDAAHDWESPIEIVGGIAENTGVFGHGGGVVMTECCMRCGCARVTDTWAQNPVNGVQGLESVSYEPGKYADHLVYLEAVGAR